MSDKMNTYEGMFLVPAGLGDFQQAREPIDKVLARVEAEALSIKPWDERRLAYEINDHKRGLYILTYFKADPERIGEIEHECQLDEGILRVMILRRERLTDDNIGAETPATAKAASDAAAAEAAAQREAATAEEATDVADVDAGDTPVADDSVEPVVEPVAETAAEPAVEPVVETAPELAAEPVVQAPAPIEAEDSGADTSETQTL